MLSVLFLLVASAVAGGVKENFRVTNGANVTLDQALTACFSNNSSPLCTYSGGCCNGHGVCSVSSGGSGLVASCVCDALPSECHGASNYDSTTKCATLPGGAVCCDGNDVDFLASGNCHASAAYPERGAKGTLLRRVGNEQRYADNYAQIRNETFENITSMANDLMSSARPDNTILTTGNMLGLGFLEVVVKDIVHYAYFDVTERNRTFDGVTYPALKWQQNTGINGTNYSIPKAFENTATSVVDLGPLYDYATRINGGVYLDVNPAIDYWNRTHHMPKEFLVALRYYARYHYYIARSIEEYLFGGQNSTVAPVTRVSALGNHTAAKETIFQQARRSTIRFSQALIEQTVLQLFLDNPFDSEGYHHAFFDQWFRRDEWQTRMEVGVGWTVSPFPSIRYNQEFAGDQTRSDLSHLMISGLDMFISMRNNNWDTTWADKIKDSNCDGITPADPDLTWEVLSLQHTRLSRFGSKVKSVYSADLKLNLWRAAELGLGDYALHVSKLTHANNSANAPSVADLSSTQKSDNVYYGAVKESNPIRQYRSRTSSVAMASYMPINDILIADRTSYWARNASGFPTAYKFHSKIFTTPDDGTSFYTYCYKEDSVCTEASTDAAVVLFATHPHLNDEWAGQEYAEENQFIWRSRGGLFGAPTQMFPPQPTAYGIPDFDQRRIAQNQLLTEFINPLYYHFDGLNSHAVKQSGSDIRYLHNQIVDAFATNIAFTGEYDGYCYTPDFINPDSCDRAATNFWLFICQWDWGLI